jgi:predicted PurR-regulated permease PerM
LLQFVPQFGPILALIPPALVGLFSGGFDRFLYVLILYAVIVITDGLFFQPLFMKRRALVPVWASVTAPLVLGFFFSFWGVLLAPPLLAIVFAYREHARKRSAQRSDSPTSARITRQKEP